MPSFSSAGFSSAGFSAADINATVSRVTGESLGGWIEGLVLRYTAEATSAPIIWAGDVTRVTAEVLGENIPYTLKVNREIAEVLHANLFELPDTGLQTTRMVAEVLGLAASTAGKKASVSRLVAEALTSVQTLSKGLQMPSVTVDAVSIFAVVTLNEADGPGFLGMTAANGDGFKLTWAGGTSLVTKTWTQGGVSTSSNFAYLGGPVIVDFQAPASGTPVVLTSLSTEKPEGNQASGQIHELLVFNQNVTTTKRTQYRDYLECKWLTPGCTDLKTPCDFTPVEPGEHFYTYGAVDVLGVYVGYLNGIGAGTPGTNYGTVTPDDGFTYAAVTAPGSGVSLFAIGLDTAEPLTNAHVEVQGGGTYDLPVVVQPGVDLGVTEWPFIAVAQAAYVIPEIVVGATFTVDYT